jgi:cytochrome oxidase Cu insertion factor (SCO1/SenC/PrrC family)
LLPVSIEDKTIDHSQQLIIIDKEKRIRGVYDSYSDVEIKRLEEDLKVLLYEYHNPGK